MDSWCSFLSVIILSGFVDVKFIVVDTNNITLFIQIYHFLEWIREALSRMGRLIYGNDIRDHTRAKEMSVP